MPRWRAGAHDARRAAAAPPARAPGATLPRSTPRRRATARDRRRPARSRRWRSSAPRGRRRRASAATRGSRRAASRSTPCVGSSITSSQGSSTSARAIATRTLSAPSSSPSAWLRAALGARARERAQGARRGLVPRDPARELAHQQIVEHARGPRRCVSCSAVADPLAEHRSRTCRQRPAGETHDAAVGRSIPAAIRNSVEQPAPRLPQTATIRGCRASATRRAARSARARPVAH